jgi:pentatricopeptide repeat protein
MDKKNLKTIHDFDKRAFADSYFKLGDIKKAESLYEEWLKQDPKWGWGWIGYSDCWMDWKEKQDFEKAEEILKRGLAVPRVEDRVHIIERLVNLYEESDRPEEAKKLRDYQSLPAAKISKVKYVIPSKKRRKRNERIEIRKLDEEYCSDLDPWPHLYFYLPNS